MPVPSRPISSRRQFLQRAALLAGGTPALILFLDACAKSEQTSSAPSMKIASPDKPVTWDIAKDNEPIADGLAPEKAATLQLYSYADYVSPGAVKSFEEKYGVTVAVSTFNDTDEAITKIRAGSVDYDVFFPSYDQIGKLVNGSLLRPLNHSYIPNIKNVWPVFTNPFYDQQWRYTTPYTVYTTGIEGMEPAEAAPLLQRLYQHSVHPNLTCRVRWTPGMLTIWDNRCTQHLAINDYGGQRREMYRTSVRGSAPIAA